MANDVGPSRILAIEEAAEEMRLCSSILVASCAAVAVFGAPAPYSVDRIAARSGDIRNGSIPLPRLTPGHGYSLLFSITSPSTLTAESRLDVTVTDGNHILASKTLHAG